jgi:hypothetical protein
MKYGAIIEFAGFEPSRELDPSGMAFSLLKKQFDLK